MRIGVAQRADRTFLALDTPTALIDLSAAAHASLAAPRVPTSVDAFLALGEPALRWARRVLAAPPRNALVAPEEAQWRAPILAPQKICGIGLNYADHCREQGLEPPTSPILFAKYATSLAGPEDTIPLDARLTQAVDYEAELAVVIGRHARRVPPSTALEHVGGYTCANDVSARDLQKKDGQFVRAKSLEGFCPLGPVVVTPDEMSEPGRLRIQARVNGEPRQDSNTSNLIFGIADLVSFLSDAFPLAPGDVILTGTPSGVGAHRKPPVFLADGDSVEVEIEQIGILRNRFRARAPG